MFRNTKAASVNNENQVAERPELTGVRDLTANIQPVCGRYGNSGLDAKDARKSLNGDSHELLLECTDTLSAGGAIGGPIRLLARSGVKAGSAAEQ
jgi:hypothetical protein